MKPTFAWDPVKEHINIRKHEVSFAEASTVFHDELGITIHDPDHSDHEDRFIIIGRSSSGRFMLVVHTDRNDTVRIISARVLTRKERIAYEKEIISRQGL